MSKIFSWKVGVGKYAYLLKSSQNSYIRNRITDTDALAAMSRTIDGYSESEYANEFNALKNEVLEVYGYDLGDYGQYYNLDTNNQSRLILLTGKDGDNATDNTRPTTLTSNDYNNIKTLLQEQKNELRNSITENNEYITNLIQSQAASDIGNAIQNLEDAVERIEELQGVLSESVSGAQAAIQQAQAVLGDGDITLDDLVNVFNNVSEAQTWLDGHIDSLTSLEADYNSAKTELGIIGTSEDVTHGVLSVLAGNINTISGTVSTVSQELNAQLGQISNAISFFNESADTISQITQTLNGSESYINQMVSYMNGTNDTTNLLYQAICGQTGTIVDGAISQTTDRITSLSSEINALSGYIENNLSTMNDETLTTIRNNMNVLSGTVSTNITKLDTISGNVKHISDSWAIESGTLRTVSEMVIKKDDRGHLIYVKNGTDAEYALYEDGYFYDMEGNRDPYLKISDMTPVFSDTMSSYIQQQANAITLSVNSGNVTAALRMEVTEDNGSLIYGLADNIILDSDVVANSLTTSAANIGGVVIGEGEIYSSGSNGSYLLDSQGRIYANDVYLKGSLSATSGVIGGYEIKGNRIEMNDESGHMNGVLNSSSGISTNEDGRIMFAAGVSERNKLYAWSAISETLENRLDMHVIYTFDDYAVSGGIYTQGTEKTAYVPLFNNNSVCGIASAVPCTLSHYTTSNEHSSNWYLDNLTGSTSGGEPGGGSDDRNLRSGGQLLGFKVAGEGGTNEDIWGGGGGYNPGYINPAVIEGQTTTSTTQNANNASVSNATETTIHNMDLLGVTTANTGFIGLNKVVICPNCGASYSIYRYSGGCPYCFGYNDYYNDNRYSAVTFSLIRDTNPVNAICIATSSGSVYFLREEESDIELTDTQVVDIASELAKFKVFENGTMYSEKAYINGGNFAGDIDSDGFFRGKLDNAGGILSNAQIIASNFNGDVYIPEHSTFVSVNNSGYTKIISDNENVTSSYPRTTIALMCYEAHEHQRRRNFYSTYGTGKNGVFVGQARFHKDATITIPPTSSYFKIISENNNPIQIGPLLGILAKISYDDGTESIIILKDYERLTPTLSGMAFQYTYNTQETVLSNAKANGYITFYFQWQISMCGKNTDCYVSFKPKKRLVIDYPSPSVYGEYAITHFGSDGVKMSYGSATSITLKETTIEMRSGASWFKITPSGISYQTSVMSQPQSLG